MTGSEAFDVLVERGEWEPRRRQEIPLPENLAREVTRLVWWLDDIGCVRSPFISHPDCFAVEGMKPSEMCARCRALLPYREVVRRA